MVGYHHVLMILIALAIILLCMFLSLPFAFLEALDQKVNLIYMSSRPPALLLAGCSSSSPQIPSIFLISLFYEKYSPIFDPAQVDPGVYTAISNIVGGAQLEVRVGYFGICIQPDGGSFICNANASALADIVSVDQDPLNLIWVASTFKDAVVFPYLM